MGGCIETKMKTISINIMPSKFPADHDYPKKIWAVYDHINQKLLERYKSKVAGDKSYTRVYKSFEMANNYIENYLSNDKERYEIYEYCLVKKQNNKI